MLLSTRECYRVFGDPRKENSLVSWTVPAELRRNPIPQHIYCNKLLVPYLEKAFKALINTGKIEELKSWDGCFNIRMKKGSNHSLSLHAWGLAVDVNAETNRWNHQPNLSPEFVKCWTDAGFDWGGNWGGTKDGMHFQIHTLKG